ncbi:MAG: glycosyltransferase [Bacteroidales bacterium]|nr:glycosyltransferase [Bacteroidales bacterium]
MKTLILLTDNYPITHGEFFIDDEMRVIADRFEKVIVVVKSQQSVNFNRYVPKNMIVYPVSDFVSFFDKVKALPKILSSFFMEEWRFAIKNYKLKPSVILFKLMYMDVVRALKVKKQLLDVLFKEAISQNKTIYYSYWNDYKALALSLMKAKNNSMVCVSRAHGWDVFFERHQPPYLPFKKFIVSNLDVTYSISEAGRKAFISLLGNEYNNKIAVSRLGKINHRLPIENKNHDGILICSCSHIIPLKRIHLIVELLAILNIKNLKWVHFGDGPLRNRLEELAQEKLQYVKYEFKGNVPNEEILDFYHKNYVDLFINLSESEGVPVSIMEALSAGIPVLATNVGGVCEVVNQKVGFLVPKGFKVDDVAKIIKNYLNLPDIEKQQYRENAYQFWKENFEAEKNYGEFVKKIFELCV